MILKANENQLEIQDVQSISNNLKYYKKIHKAQTTVEP